MIKSLLLLIIAFSFTAVFADSSDDINSLFAKGVESFYLIELDEAMSYFDQVLEIDPLHLDAIANKGGVLFQLGKYYKAIPYFDQVLEIDPSHIGALSNKGGVLFQLGKFDKAMSYFDQVLEIDPNHVYALNGKASIFVQTGKLDEAQQYFDDILKIEPNHKFTKKTLMPAPGLHYKYVDGTLEILVHDSENRLTSYIQTHKIQTLDHSIAENRINSWPIVETINKDGQDFEVHKLTSSRLITEDSVSGGDGFSIPLIGLDSNNEILEDSKRDLWLLKTYHNLYPIKEGDTITTHYTILIPVE